VNPYLEQCKKLRQVLLPWETYTREFEVRIWIRRQALTGKVAIRLGFNKHRWSLDLPELSLHSPEVIHGEPLLFPTSISKDEDALSRADEYLMQDGWIFEKKEPPIVHTGNME
jgi:hypothetical protein